MPEIPATMRQLRSLVTPDGELRLSVATVDTPRPGPHEVLVRVEAAPVNPSDLALLLARADISRTVASGSDGVTGVTVMAPIAEALLGRTVAFLGGATYGEYCLASTRMCLPLRKGADAVDGASSFVNPLTALGMVETMRREGHTALVHTAAASNLGQMLNRICLADHVPLVNIVRKPEQAALLRAIGATWICDASAPSFMSDLTEALAATGATLAFDAIGGGKLAGQILTCMEAALNRNAKEYSRYGSTTHKQVYLYGSLDT